MITPGNYNNIRTGAKNTPLCFCLDKWNLKCNLTTLAALKYSCVERVKADTVLELILDILKVRIVLTLTGF